MQSSAAGGHRATFDQRREPGIEALPQLVHSIGRLTGLPVIAAGGIATPEHVAAALIGWSPSEQYDAAAPPGYPAIHHLTAPLRRWAADHDNRDHLHLWAGTGHRHARPGTTHDLLTAFTP